MEKPREQSHGVNSAYGALYFEYGAVKSGRPPLAWRCRPCTCVAACVLDETSVYFASCVLRRLLYGRTTRTGGSPIPAIVKFSVFFFFSFFFKSVPPLPPNSARSLNDPGIYLYILCEKKERIRKYSLELNRQREAVLSTELKPRR